MGATLGDTDKAVELREQWAEGLVFSEATVDADAGIIRGVKALGRISANGRVYSERAMQDAVRLYDGVKVYLDHPTERESRERQGVRSVRDLVGELRQPRLAESGAGVRGDLHLLDPSSTEGRKVLAVATRMPRAMGHSHRAWGPTSRQDDGTDVVEGLERVASLDLVSDPATTRGLYESITDDEPPEEDDVSKLTLEQLKKDHPALVEQVLAEAKDTERVATLEEELKRLREWKADREAEDAARERNEHIDSAIKRAKLPEAAVSEDFRATLVEAKDTDVVDRLVADRAKLWESARKSAGASGKPRSDERDPDEVVEGGQGGKKGKDRPYDDDEFSQLAEAAFIGGAPSHAEG